jgi:hypothetical protein
MVNRRLVPRAGGALLLGMTACVLIALQVHQRAGAVSSAQSAWALRRVHAAVFPSFPPADVGCFMLRPGHSQIRVFVVDPSYTDYQTVQCDTSVRRSGAGYFVTVTQSWDGVQPPATGVFGWVQRLFYRPPHHVWSYRVLPQGNVIILPEQGERTPQSYTH